MLQSRVSIKFILGSIASLLTTPLDNIKTKLQTQLSLSTCESERKNAQTIETVTNNKKHECTVDSNVKYKDMISTAKIIYKEDGFVKGFLRGMLPRVLCNTPSCAISWATYEFVKYSILKHKSNAIKN